MIDNADPGSWYGIDGVKYSSGGVLVLVENARLSSIAIYVLVSLCQCYIEKYQTTSYQSDLASVHVPLQSFHVSVNELPLQLNHGLLVLDPQLMGVNLEA